MFQSHLILFLYLLREHIYDHRGGFNPNDFINDEYLNMKLVLLVIHMHQNLKFILFKYLC